MYSVMSIVNSTLTHSYFYMGAETTHPGKERVCGGGNKPHHTKPIQHLFSAVTLRGTTEISEQPADVLLCLHGSEDVDCWL